MKNFLLLALLFIVPSIVLPQSSLPAAQAQRGLPQAQIGAIDQWAAVIRKGRNAKVMYQVSDLLKQVIARVETRKDERNSNFVIALRQMQKAAKFRAQGLEKRNKKLLNDAESRIRLVIQVVNGRLLFD